MFELVLKVSSAFAVTISTERSQELAKAWDTIRGK